MIQGAISAVGNLVSSVGSVYNFLTSITLSNVEHALVKAGVFLVSLTLVIIGFMAVAQQ